MKRKSKSVVRLRKEENRDSPFRVSKSMSCHNRCCYSSNPIPGRNEKSEGKGGKTFFCLSTFDGTPPPHEEASPKTLFPFVSDRIRGAPVLTERDRRHSVFLLFWVTPFLFGQNFSLRLYTPFHFLVGRRMNVKNPNCSTKLCEAAKS